MACLSVASRSQRVSLIVIPFCLSVCLDVCRSFRDLQPTTIDRSQPTRTRVSLFGSPISHTFGARGKNMQNLACERDASCHMTCLSVCLSPSRMSREPHVRTSPNSLCVSDVAMARSSSDSVVIVRYVCLLYTSDAADE